MKRQTFIALILGGLLTHLTSPSRAEEATTITVTALEGELALYETSCQTLLTGVAKRYHEATSEEILILGHQVVDFLENELDPASTSSLATALRQTIKLAREQKQSVINLQKIDHDLVPVRRRLKNDLKRLEEFLRRTDKEDEQPRSAGLFL